MADGFFNTNDTNAQSKGANPYQQTAPPTGGRTKTCKYCGSQIPANAKICPYCRKKQKGKGGLIAVIVIVILIIIIAAAASGDDEPKKVASSDSTSSSSVKSDSSSTKKKEKNDDTTFTVGDTADFDGVKVRLSSAIVSKGNKSKYITPDDGKYFLELIFDIENDSDEDITVSSVMSFEAYCDDTSIDQDIFGQQADEVDGLGQLDGNVASGKKMNGVISYQVPKDFKKFEITYAPDYWGNKEVTFVIPRKKVDMSAVK